ncbi:MAG: phosphoribosylformylglycinamidine synthase [Lachnospiraceae bacterium]|nr:phosphoribosylformylglycinamidine synthase [Lachnospiraceae bacterium]
MSVRRLYVEKKPEYAVMASELLSEIKSYLLINSVDKVRVLIRYDVENISDKIYEKAIKTVFSEPPVDTVIEENLDTDGAFVFSVEYLPGQYDQRADSAEQCVKFLDEKEEPVIKTAVTYMIYGKLTDKEKNAIKAHCINPVDSRETSLDKPSTLISNYDEPDDVIVFTGFADMSDDKLKELYDSLSLAMTYKDFLHIQNYYKNEEHRDPTMTEIRVLDTYWSDHCRHTTFSTELKNVSFKDGFYNKPIKASFDAYKDTMSELYKGRDDKYVCLMDIALMAMKKLKKDGFLNDQEESDEINACSIVVPVKVDGKDEEWLVSFKNETHNHPTEIEPFGGAATCLGGAIRDPLSGRSYVYQAMRITGAADPTVPVSDTLEGKLPQRKIVTSAAHGYSSYGNQIGLATGYVKEIYHPNYVAKRMEVGAVMGASPRRCVKRLNSDPGDIIVLLGGKTGRDGCGGATGSSKIHTSESLSTCGAEVQKGNAPTERKIQRLFRREEVASLIKKCNDFGAGGVSVAIGELAAGLEVELDKVPKKYAGLDGTELAISESQERMAVVIDPKDVDTFMGYAAEENLEATVVAVVTKEPRLVLKWRGKKIVDLSRAFLDTNGAHQETDVVVDMPDEKKNYFKVSYDGDVRETWLKTLSDLNECSQKGLVERFDSSIGAGTVLMPYGGKYQLTETQSMVAHLPLLKGKTDTVTMMSYGFDPYISSWSPYHGAIYAITDSIAKIVATGGDYSKIRFSFQEYFKRMTGEPERYSEPVSALLGAFNAQMGYKLPSIGGKDSMSGTFNDIDVPPTLISFAVAVGSEKNIVSPEFKAAGDALLLFRIKKDEYDLPCYEQVMKVYDYFHKLVCEGKIKAAYAIDAHGIAAAVSKMGFGNKIGADIYEEVARETVFGPGYGNIIAEVSGEYLDEILESEMAVHVGETCEEQDFFYEDMSIPMDEAIAAWRKPLIKVFPEKAVEGTEPVPTKLYEEKNVYVCKNKVAKPHVFIPVFPGTNCEYDSAKAFERAGATVTTKVFLNQTEEEIRESVEVYKKEIANAQIVMFPGGFSAGDEPDGSAKFFATAFRNEVLKEELNKLIKERDGLALGICNGFQALIKLGLVPYGEVMTQKEDSPTLTYNTIGRHISKVVYTKVVSNKSPWLQNAKLGEVYAIPASHGEGRFVANREWLDKLIANGQVATQYVDINGNASMDEEWNINGSYMAIEGITSPDGRVFGKMAHAERRGDYVAINIYGNQDMQIFESGVKYFK